MSRFQRFAHALVSGYLLLAVNTAFTLASIPLALHYLTKSAYGLWALTAQITGFIGLIDLGMAGAFARLLIDHKDDRSSGRYGGLVRTGLLVSVVQAGLVLGVGAAAGFLLGEWLEIEPNLRRDFQWVMVGQAALLALTFASRTLTNLLVAHQRYDVVNVAQTISFVANFAALWASFARGAGLFSLLWGSLAAAAVSQGIIAFAAIRLGTLPRRGEWGAVTWAQFREMFLFGKDVFLFSVGGQLIFTSQTILVTRSLGLEASALWSICSRTFGLATQVIYRVFDLSCPALAEMIVRGERARLQARFRSIVVVTLSLAMVGVALLVTCNGSFVAVWTGGRFHWPAVNDALLGIWLLVCALSHAHVGLVGQTKDFKFLRWVYFVEGLLFVTLSWLVIPRTGLTGMLACSIAASLICSFPYGLWRVRLYYGLSWRELLLEWSRPGLRLAAWIFPLAAGLWWLVLPWPAPLQLGVCGTTLSVVGGCLLIRIGIEPHIRKEIQHRLPVPLRSVGEWLLGGAG